MKDTVYITVDSTQQDMGVSALIEAYRELFEAPSGRQQIADLMTLLAGNRSRFNRQMIEKWFRADDRTLPSATSLVTLLWACKLLKQQEQQKTRKSKAA